MNFNQPSAPIGMRLPSEEEKRRMMMMQRPTPPPQPVQPPIQQIQQTQLKQDHPWGQGQECIGLKILLGVFALIIVVLVIVMIVRMTKKKVAAPAPASPPTLPMSLAGGGFDMESLMSTA